MAPTDDDSDRPTNTLLAWAKVLLSVYQQMKPGEADKKRQSKKSA